MSAEGRAKIGRVVAAAACVAVLVAGRTEAADTGWKTAGTVTTVNPAVGANWTGTFTLANLNTSDNAYASVSGTGGAATAALQDFAFGVPGGAIVSSIEVEVEGNDATAGQTVRYDVDLSWNGGTTYTNFVPFNQSSPVVNPGFTGTVDATTVLGAGSLWGRAWTAAEFSDANFRIRIARASGTGNLQVDRIRVRVSYYTTPWPAGSMQMRTGTYLGDSTNGRAITGIGFQPDVVIVIAAGNPARDAVVRTATMGAGDVSASGYQYNYAPLLRRIQSLDADGFTVGEPPDHNIPNDDTGMPYHCVNHAGTRYYWTAFKAAAGELELGVYRGDGTNPRDITALSFRPDYVMVTSTEVERITHRTSAMPVDKSYDIEGGDYCPAVCAFGPAIRDMLANGFRLGGFSNQLNITFHYVAWKALPGRAAFGQYVGNLQDNRSIAGVGFRPEFVSVTPGTPVAQPAAPTTVKTGSMGASTDLAQPYILYNPSGGTDKIQALEANGFELGADPDVNDAGQTYYWVAFGPGSEPMQVLSGAYVGNGVDNRAIAVGFQPDVVFVKRDEDARWMQVRTSTMSATKAVDASATVADGIKSMSATGFVLGTNANVNAANAPYHWIAFRAGAGEMKVGSYGGNATLDNRAITGVGFQPDYVMVVPEAAFTPVHRSSSLAGDWSWNFNDQQFGPPGGNMIQNLLADGFEVGTDSNVNGTGTTYHYVAWKEVAGRVDVGTYTGNATNPRSITGPGFMPEWVLVKRAGASGRVVHKTASTGVSSNYSMFFSGDVGFSQGTANDITGLISNGFRVTAGGGEAVDRAHQNGTVYYYVAFGPHAATPIYYSVGTNGAQLHSSNASAAMGTLTLVTAAPNNVGMGDEVRVGVNRYYITGRSSPTVFTIENSAANGGVPGASNITFSSTGITIFRAFTSLSFAESLSTDASHLNTADLVTGNYQLNWVCYNDGPMNDQFVIDGYTTGVDNFIRVFTPVFPTQVGVSQRHTGRAGTGFRLVPTMGNDVDTIEVLDNHVRIEGLEIDGSQDPGSPNGVGGIWFHTTNAAPVAHIASHNVIHHTRGFTGICVESMAASVFDNIVYATGHSTIGAIGMVQAGGTAYVYSNTVYDHNTLNNNGWGIGQTAGTLVAKNNVSMNPATGFDFVGTFDAASRNNVSSDNTAPGPNSQISKVTWATYFQTITSGLENLHLRADSGGGTMFGGYGVPLHQDPNQYVGNDIDGGARDATQPDMGADEFNSTTAVKLASFGARGFDSAVLVEWQTASELDNLGFHLYRASGANGPWTRLNAARIPGLGSSPEGRRYAWPDRGLTNDRTWFYRLEDVDRSGLVTSHGPVSATTVAGVRLGDEGEAPEAPAPEAQTPGAAWTAHGNPGDVALRVLRRTSREALLELRTAGFYSQAQPDGTVRLFVPGFFDSAEPGLPALPVKRAWIDAVVGRGARVVGVRAGDLRSFPGLLPQLAGAPEAQARRDGTYRAAFRRVAGKPVAGLYPQAAARVLETAFQGEQKKAYLELAPLRVDGRGRLWLTQRLVVRIVFDGRVDGEWTSGRDRGRRQPPRRGPGGDAVTGAVIARFAARAAGLHGVPWEALEASGAAQQLAVGGGAVKTTSLRLSRLGRPVAFHVEPRADRYGPGSTLYFLAEGPEAAYGTETVYELRAASGGLQMALGATLRAGAAAPVDSLVESRAFEVNANYLPGLLEARDGWLWDYGLAAPSGADYPFVLAPPAAGEALLSVDVQGGSEAKDVDPDHEVRVLVNGVPVGEAQWDGLTPGRLEVPVDPSVLLGGGNTLRLEALDVAGAPGSVVYLDRFSLRYPRQLAAESGRLSGRATASGVARATGFAEGTVVLDTSGASPVWLAGSVVTSTLEFPVQAGRSYLAVSPEAVLRAEVRAAHDGASLRDPSRQADWIVIAPDELLPAADRLVSQRESQGLKAAAVSLEQVQDEFGYGERSPQVLRDFLAHAYHQWKAPSPRYVLLLGDASYDPKGNLAGTTRRDLLPTPFVKSSFLWTASDPTLAAVNGDDAIPDIAIGRLSAGSLAEAEAAVGKILAFETSGQTLDGNAVLVADNPDLAGDFEANANDVASLLPGRKVDRIFLTQYGSAARAAVLGAFDAGASLVSYVGHGSQVLWASERMLLSIDVASLKPQPRQPLMLTMTCSNGYFVSPFLNGITERFVLEGDKGAIAAFSPSGLSLDGAAHLYHRALLQELQSGRHARLGDLVLAAQGAYAATGSFPELLSLYHLFGDPALKLR